MHGKEMKAGIACKIWNSFIQRASASIPRLCKFFRHAHFKVFPPYLRPTYTQGVSLTHPSLQARLENMPASHRVALAVATIAFMLLSSGVADQDDEAVRFWFRNYLAWHDMHRTNATRVAVFLPIKAGLADNVKGMLNMWAYAVLTRRILLLNAEEPVPIADVLSQRAIGRFVYRREFDGEKSTWKGDDLKYTYVSGLTPSMRELLRGRQRTVALHMSKAQPIMTLIPKLRSIEYGSTRIPPFTRAARRAAAKVLLEPNPLLIRTVNDFTRRVGAPYLAVHARLGRGTNEARHHRFAAIRGRERDIALCLARQAKRLARNEQQPIFIATDTPSFRRLFRAALHREMPRASVHHVRGSVAHYRWLKGGDAGRKAHFAMHAENLLIGSAEHIIALESGFPEIAYWRGHARLYKKVLFKDCGL